MDLLKIKRQLGGNQTMTGNAHTVVLISGGIDSASVTAACRQKGIQPSGVFVDYGQPSARSEWRAAQDIARHFGVTIRKVSLGFQLASQEGEFYGRNALLVLATTGMMEPRPLQIALGIHALSEYYDTTPLFVRHMGRILNGYFGDSVTLNAPFLAESKAEVIEFAKKNHVPLELTYSCEVQNAPACGWCPSCRDRIDNNAG